MSDRLTGLIVLVVALAFFASATQLEMPFFSDPLGPKVFPMLISGVAIISATFLITKPDKEPEWPTLSTFYKLRFPAAIPNIFSGLKISAGLSVIGAIVGEFDGVSIYLYQQPYKNDLHCCTNII